MRRPISSATFFLSTVLILAVPGRADWIKTRDGALVETRGPWQVKGSQVVFTSTRGTLSSLRLTEVDLDASAVATVEAKAARSGAAPPAAAAPEVERQPVLVVTNKDVARARRSTPGPAEEEGGEGAPDSPRGPETAVEVISWRPVESPETGGIEILGTLQNRGREIVTDLRVIVSLIDEEGAPLDRANAFLGAVSLAPTATARLRAVFPDVDTTAVEARFEVRDNPVRVLGVVAAPEEAESVPAADGNES